MTALKIIYLANIIVTAWISYLCIFRPKLALTYVFTGAYEFSGLIRLVGVLWGAILVLSFIGLFYPEPMSLVLFFQLIYKSSWLLLIAIPDLARQKQLPVPMAIFFIIWVLVLPFVIPWSYIFPAF